MADLCFLFEKGKQMGTVTREIGGTSGTICGHTYTACHARGHLLELPDPEKMVKDKELKKKLKSWSDMSTMPWDWRKFNWKKVPIANYGHKYLQNIKSTAKGCDAIVISTDDDPDAEGDLLGWEIVNAIGWHGTVYRILPVDLSKGSIIRSVKNMQDVTDQKHQGRYLKALGRSRWDYLSMPETRIATHYAEAAGYGVKGVVNEGRLKSVVLLKIFEQLQAIKNYHKTPYYEVRFKDQSGHVYKRKVQKDQVPSFRFKNKSDCQKDMANYQPAKIANVQVRTCHQQPPKMLSLDELSTDLSKRGCYPKQFAKLYESMYMDSYVSYPRTADTGITKGQFAELLPKAKQIAKLVGVDPKLLTHTTLRRKHYTAHADHGANRPGTNVPQSLNGLADKFGSKYAPVIYKILAKSFLAILAEDYVYKRVTASPDGYSDFKGSFNIPEAYNFKEITGKPSDKKIDFDQWKNETAKPFIYVGSNPKPTWPNQKWVVSFLKKNNVGTGATRTHVLTDLVGHGKRVNRQVKIISNRGKFKLNRAGMISAVMAMNTFIGSVDVTNALHDIMDSVGKFKHTIADVCHMATVVVQHDKPIMAANAKMLGKYGIKKGSSKMQQTPKVEVKYHGTPVQIKNTWGGHKWTHDELEALSRNEVVTIKGKYGPVSGKLGKGSYNGHSYIGFQKLTKADDPNYYHGTFDGKKINIKKTWGKHTITPDEFKKLCDKKQLTFKEYTFPVKLAKRKKGKRSFIGIDPQFND